MNDQNDFFAAQEPIMDEWADMKTWHSTLDVMNMRLDKLEQDNIPYCPARENILRAYELTPLNAVRVVILGQDPYPDPRNANGLAFSVSHANYPKSLRNIFQELVEDESCAYPKTGDLTRWAEQGVLLLNTTLTVTAHNPASHAGWGWEGLVRETIATIVQQRRNVVFILWGQHAFQAASDAISDKVFARNKHHMIRSAHPSPMAADRGFFGSKPFSRANNFLRKCGVKEIEWCLNAL